MHRCYVRPEDWGPDGVTLTGSEAHHLRDVLRARSEEPVSLFDGRGRVAVAIPEPGRGGAENRKRSPGGQPSGGMRFRILSETRVAPPYPALVLLPAVCKAPRMDDLVEKATELGVSALRPMVTERTVAANRGAEARGRMERWRRIAVSAAKQCGAAWVPEVYPVNLFPEALRHAAASDLRLIASLEPDAVPLEQEIPPRRPVEPSSVAILIGPEGDFTPREYRQARLAGFRPVHFGPTVLRVETAALYALCVLRHAFSARA